MGPRAPHSTVLLVQEEAIVAFRRHTLLPLDDCLYALQATIPHLTRSSLHRCLQRHGISRLPEVTGTSPPRRSSRPNPIGYFHNFARRLKTLKGLTPSSSFAKPSSRSTKASTSTRPIKCRD
jgi:hypothetical protein